MVGFTGVLAHQGGWDELLLVAVPVVVFVVLLRVANARAAHLGDGPDEVGKGREGEPGDQGERGERGDQGDGPHPRDLHGGTNAAPDR